MVYLSLSSQFQGVVDMIGIIPKDPEHVLSAQEADTINEDALALVESFLHTDELRKQKGAHISPTRTRNFIELRDGLLASLARR